MKPPRYLFVPAGEEGVYVRYLGGPDIYEPLLLVEEADGRFRHATGADLAVIDRLFPGFLGKSHLKVDK